MGRRLPTTARRSSYHSRIRRCRLSRTRAQAHLPRLNLPRSQPCDTTGQNVGGVWLVVNPYVRRARRPAGGPPRRHHVLGLAEGAPAEDDVPELYLEHQQALGEAGYSGERAFGSGGEGGEIGDREDKGERSGGQQTGADASPATQATQQRASQREADDAGEHEGETGGVAEERLQGEDAVQDAADSG